MDTLLTRYTLWLAHFLCSNPHSEDLCLCYHISIYMHFYGTENNMCVIAMAQFQDQKRGRFNLLYDVLQFIYILLSQNILNKFRKKFYAFFCGIHPQMKY